MVASVQPRLTYRAHGEVLNQFGRSDAFMNVLRGPLGSGKSKCCVAWIIDRCAKQRADKNGIRRSRWVACRNTYPDLIETTIKTEFRPMVNSVMGKFVMGHPPTCTMDFALPDGTRVEAEVVFLALDQPDDIRKLRGMQLTGIWFNELRFIPMSIVREGLSRCDRYPQPGFSTWVGGIADTNSWDQDHALEELMAYFSGSGVEIEDANRRDAFEQMRELGAWKFFNQPAAVVPASEGEKGAYCSFDGKWFKVNPDAENIHILSPTYYARQIAGAKSDWIRVNLGNETGLAIDGKPVHPEYQESVHKSDKILLPAVGRPIYCGMDYGLTPAAAFLQPQLSGRWHGLDELVCFDMGAERFADALKRKVAEIRAMIPRGDQLEFVFRGDPSGDNRSQTDEKTYFSVLRANGIPALPASTNDPTVRRDALTRPLTRMVAGGSGILLSPKMKMFSKALKGAWYYERVKAKGSERFKDQACKNDFSHIGEAGEYALLDAGEHSVVNSSQAKRFPRGPVTARIPATGRDYLDVGW